eukprot:c29305_g1_i1 orf=195-5231(+)
MDERGKRVAENDTSVRMAVLGAPFAFDGATFAQDGSGVEAVHAQNKLPPLVFRKPVSGPRLAEGVAVLNEDSIVDPGQDASVSWIPKNVPQGRSALPVPQSFPRLGVTEIDMVDTNPIAYEDLAGVLREKRVVSGSLSDASVSASEKAEISSSIGLEGMPMPQVFFTCSGDSPAPRVKFMCSFGGKIMPRPSDGKLRYVGGETRIISVSRHINYANLMRKMTETYGESLSLKYQLPDEDLDALISVSSDEDLENMMEEYDRLDAGEGSLRLRVFLSGTADYEFFGHLNDIGDPRNSEQIYVDAVNGLTDENFRRRADTVCAGSAHDLMRLDTPQPRSNSSGLSENVSIPFLTAPVPWGVVVSVMQSAPVGVVGPPKEGSMKTSFSNSSKSSSPPKPSQPSHCKAASSHSGGLRSEGSNQDMGQISSADSSINSQQDFHYNFADSRKLLDSPSKPQQELCSSGNIQAHLYQTEGWRNPEPMIPYVDSYGFPLADQHGLLQGVDTDNRMRTAESDGKCTKLEEHLVELPSQSGISDKMSDGYSSDLLGHQMDLHCVVGQEQHKQKFVPDTWHYHLEKYPTNNYSKVDLKQQSGLDSVDIRQQILMQPQQQSSIVYSYPVALHEPILYHQQQQQQQQQRQEEILPGHVAYKADSSDPIFQMGSAPSSPHMGLMDSSGQQIEGQHHYALNGALTDEEYMRWLHYADAGQIIGSYQPSNLPLHYQEVMIDPYPVHAKYEPVQVLTNFSDEAIRPTVTSYGGVNPYQEGAAMFQTPQEDAVSQFLLQGQQSNPVSHPKSRYKFQGQQMQPGDQSLVHCYKDGENDVIWGFQQRSDDSTELRGHTEAQTWMVKMDSQEDIVDPITNDHTDIGQANFSTPYLPDESSSFLGLAENDPFVAVQHRKEEFDLPGNTALHVGATMRPPGMPGQALTMDRIILSDALHGAHLVGKSETDCLQAQPISGAAAVILDSRRVMPLTHFPVATPASNASAILSAGQRRHVEKAAGIVSSQGSSQASLLLPSTGLNTSNPLFSEKLVAEQWGGNLGMASMRSELSRYCPMEVRHLDEDDGEQKSGLLLDREESRSGSGSNMINLGESLVHSSGLTELHSSYKQVNSKTLIDADTVGPPFSVHQTQPNDVSKGTFPAVVASLATGFDTVTENKLSQSAISSSTESPAASFSGEAFSLSSDVAQHAVNLTSASTVLTTATILKSDGSQEREFSAITIEAELLDASNCSSFEVPEKLNNNCLLPVFDTDLTQKQPNFEGVALVNVFGEVGSYKQEDRGDKVRSECSAEKIGVAATQPTLFSSPTLSIQEWEKSLQQAELEEQAAADVLIEEKNSGVKLNIITEKEVTFEEFKLGIEEDDTDEFRASQPSNIAAIAEAEAIAHGLQTIKHADLEELRELGTGTFGTVYHGKWRGSDVAIKRIKSSCFTGRPSERERLIADFWQEARILSQLHHPNVVAFYGVVPDGPGGTLATVTEYMVNGSLKQVLQRKDRTIDRRKRLLIAMDAAFGMEYLHGKNIVHFDLKCENLLVNMRDPQRPICKVGDLGLSKVKHQTLVSGGVRGTLPWMAPELLNGSSSLVSEKVDVFSFGITMWELLTGEEPYSNMHYGAIIGGIVNNTLRPPIPGWCDPAWRSLMERCWSADPHERPAFSEIAGKLRAMAALLHGKGQGQAHALGQAQV